jgi:hypothetical protein
MGYNPTLSVKRPGCATGKQDEYKQNDVCEKMLWLRVADGGHAVGPGR